MVRCQPAEPDFATAAERDVWRAFKRRLRVDDAWLANVRFTDERGDHELDLVVGLPGVGVAVIEVKGSSVSYDGQGWVQRGGLTKRIDPVGQARRGKYVLRDHLDIDPHWRGEFAWRTWLRSRTPNQSRLSPFPVAPAGWSWTGISSTTRPAWLARTPRAELDDTTPQGRPTSWIWSRSSASRCCRSGTSSLR
jgi:hypothetical protein